MRGDIKSPLFLLALDIILDKMRPITKLQKSLPQKVRLKQAEEILEHLEIADMLNKRLKSYRKSETISWEKVKAKKE